MGKREENKRRKREAIEQHGCSQFAEHGFEAASIEAIAKESGVARGTFYLYYPDKLSLFDALMERWVEPVSQLLGDVAAQLRKAQTPADCLEVYRGMGMGLAIIGLAQQDVILVAFRETRQPGDAGQLVRAREQRLLDQAVELTAEVAERGLITVRDPRLTCLVILGAIERLFYEVLMGTDLGDPQLIADDVVVLFTSAMGIPT